MATTKALLIQQTDQLLNQPTVQIKIALKDTPTNRALNIIWAQPAIADRTLTLPDPTADDSFVYLNAAQTITNKTLGTGTTFSGAPFITDFTNAQHNHSNAVNGGSVSHGVLSNLSAADDHTQYAYLAGRAGGQIYTAGSAAGNALTLRSTTHATKGGILIDQDSVTLGATKNINVSGGGEVLGLPATPSGLTASTSKDYVDTAISLALTGDVVWREVLLSNAQLDSTNDGIAQAVAFYLTAVAVLTDTFIIKNGSSTETFTFSAANGVFAPAVGVTASDSMTNLVSRINTDSLTWSAALRVDLQAINSTTVVIYKKVPSTPPTDRIYGVFTTPATARYVNFGGTQSYTSSVNAQLPAVDPVTASFGFARVTAGLKSHEAHLTRDDDKMYIWNDDLGIWQSTVAPTATSASGGGVIGLSTFDSDKGLLTTAGVTEVKVDGSTVTFNGSGQLQSLVSEGFLYTYVFNVVSGTVSGDIDYPAFGTDFSTLLTTSATAAGSQIDTAFDGRLASVQTTISSVKIYIKGTGSYKLRIYAEGSGASPVYDSGSVAAPGALTEVTVLSGAMSAQPTGTKRFAVVIESILASGQSNSFSFPFVKQV